eukprot:COSAG02_NODE_2147_length_9663_cov_8.071936_14_plen_49_part_00
MPRRMWRMWHGEHMWHHMRLASSIYTGGTKLASRRARLKGTINQIIFC